ncbi:hypothetical protein BDY21DRAFT_362803 [Lineolata rhizophorae]|uniref:Extracellular membrane protein CFEM domain-containing protein n=1 Tax=Lineolata rhizophorae TaxID=578093 RepID=A0A6A6P3L8_9PEZI|nr:hypothetical protein BDY21DRAFT_362803 [Lineolata rhizophorae]
MPFPCSQLFVWSTLLLLLPSLILADDVSIGEESYFSVQRDCVRVCLYNDLDNALGCPFFNDCYCRAILAPAATSALVSCVTSRCTDGVAAPSVDITSAVSVYDRYCDSAVNGADAAVPSISVAATETQQLPTVVTVVTVVTATTAGAGATAGIITSTGLQTLVPTEESSDEVAK